MSKRAAALVGLSAAVVAGAILLHRYRRSGGSRGSRFEAVSRDPVAAFLRSSDLTTLPAKEFMEIVQSQGVQTPASLARALAFVPRPGDVVTLTTPKTGQTWLLARLRKLSLGHGATDRQLAVDPMRSGGDSDSNPNPSPNPDPDPDPNPTVTLTLTRTRTLTLTRRRR